MSDLKPPRLTGDERETLHALLQYHRESIVRKVEGVDEASARESVVGSGTSLIWLVQHVNRAERLWLLRRFAGQDIDLPEDAVRPDDRLAVAVDTYIETWGVVDEVIGSAALDDRCRDVGDESPVNLRWVLMHLLEETARHAGHADILRELIDGQTGR